MVTRDCRRCGATFTSVYVNASYCPACLAPRQCAECGVTFAVSSARGIHHSHCSRSCAQRHLARGRRRDEPPVVPQPCASCGKEFISRRGGRFCSLTCANDAERARHTVSLPLVPPPRTRKDCPTERPCQHTGCRYHLPTACALDVADDGGATQETIADLLGVSKERVKQIEASACRKLVATFGRDALVDILGGQVQPIGHAAPPDPDA